MLIRFSRVRPFAALWTVVRQALLSKGFSRKEYWSGLPGPPPGDLPNPGTESESPVSPAMQADSLPNILYRIYSVYFSTFFIEYTKKKTNPNFFYICLFQIKIRSRYTCCKCESEAEWCTRNSQRRRRWGGGGFGFGGFILGGRGWGFRRGSGVNQEDEGWSQGELALRRRPMPLLQGFSKWGPQPVASSITWKLVTNENSSPTHRTLNRKRGFFSFFFLF